MSNNIVKDVNYYKELFKAFYNKRFKNVKEIKQLAEGLGYKTFCDTYQDVTIYKKYITITQREKKDFLYFKKDDFLLKNPYFGFASNICKKNQIAKNIAREIYKILEKKYPKLNEDYIISADFTSRTYDIKKFNADWKNVLEDISNILELRMQTKETIIEGVKLLVTTKSMKRYMKDGCNYSLYCDCTNCKNESWYDDDYCNNQLLHFIDNDTKTTRVYCERYEEIK